MGRQEPRGRAPDRCVDRGDSILPLGLREYWYRALPDSKGVNGGLRAINDNQDYYADADGKVLRLSVAPYIAGYIAIARTRW